MKDKPVIKTESGYCLEIVSPKDVTESEITYLKDFFSELEHTAADPKGVNPETGAKLEDYLDIRSWIDKYLLENIFQNVDSSYDSCFFYKESSSAGGRLVAGPAWDYDLTATGRFDIWNTDRVGDLYLRDQLLNNPSVKSRIQEEFTEKIVPYVRYNLSSDVYNIYRSISSSYEANSIRWSTGDDRAIDDFIIRTEKRLEVIDNKILGNNSDHLVSFIDFEGNIIKTEYVKDGESISELPECASWWAFFNGWYDKATGELLREGTPIFEDKEYEVNWIYTSLMIKNSLAELGVDIDHIDEDSVQILADYYSSHIDEFSNMGE